MALTNIPTSTDPRIISPKGEKGTKAETLPKSGDLARLQAAGSLASMAELGSFEVDKSKSTETSKTHLQSVQISSVEMAENEEINSLSDEDVAEMDAAIYAASNPEPDASTTTILGNWMFALQTVMMKATATYQTNQGLALQSADINNAQAKVFIDKLGDIVDQIKKLADIKDKLPPWAKIVIGLAVAVAVIAIAALSGGIALAVFGAGAGAFATATSAVAVGGAVVAGTTTGAVLSSTDTRTVEGGGKVSDAMEEQQAESQLTQTQLNVTQNEQQRDITTSQNQSSNIDAVQNLLQGLFRFALQLSKSQA